MMTKEELKQIRGTRTQEEMANALLDSDGQPTPLSTYQKWEQGARKVPAWVEDAMRPKKHVIPGLTLDAVYSLDRQARARNMTLEEFIGKVLTDLAKSALALALLVTLGHQITHPEDQQARRFGGRRRQEDAGAVFEIDADAVG